GSVAVNSIRFDISKSSGVRLASASASDLRLYINGGDVTPASVSHSGLGQASTSGYVIFEFPTEVVLSGATTVAFRGNVDLGDGTDTLTVSMHQDTTKTGPAGAETAGGSSASLVWSDRSASSHSSTTSDWMDSYLLQGLPMSWGLSRN
ncbi:MAG TPA: hypothetical protein VG941_00115, partial [Candidatus Paceibacterota bacterium]|nr:hypothetical protein [Candidatus Paceibacterota bacterium]